MVFLALAPLWHFAPSKRQRHQARLREAAALGGLFVEFRDLPLSAERLARLGSSERQVLYYGLRLPASRGDARPRLSWVRQDRHWLSPSGREDGPELLSELPECVLASALDEDSCGVFWREDGDETSVTEIATLLSRWRDRIVGS